MVLQERKHGAVTVLKPEGPLIGEGAQEFRLRMQEVLASSRGRCVVDATEIPYVDSKGLEALVDLNAEMIEGGQTLKLTGLTETLRLVLELTRLSNRFECFDDINSAVRSFL